MVESGVVTVRLGSELKDKLDALARSTKRSKSFLAGEAIAAFVELNAWQVGEIEAAVAEADAGDFVSDEDVARAFAKYAE